MTTSLTVRFPAELLSRLRDAARDSDRSLSAEIVHRVRRSFAATEPRRPAASPGEAVDCAAFSPGEARR
jgi:predicted transcriptional regulator